MINRSIISKSYGAVLALGFAVSSVLVVAQANQTQKIVVNHERPIIQVLDKLEAKYGWQMTYEDPPYESEKDLIDVTDAEFRRDHPGRQRLIPAAKLFEFNFVVPADSMFVDRDDVLRQLLAAHELSGNPGKFVVNHTGPVAHIEPRQLLRRDGRVVAIHSVLDSRISFPLAERNCLETLRLVLATVSKKAGVNVIPGILGVSLLNQTTCYEGSQDEPAKEVLVRVFETVNGRIMRQINQPRRTVWQMMYEPDAKFYFFHTHVVAIEIEGPLGQKHREPV